VRPVADSISMVFDVLRVRGRSRWPHIPALVVTADPEERHPVREQILEDAFGIFRRTDPVLPLSDNRALLLLPLCKSHQVNDTASRLSRTSHNLMVRKRLVSCTELAGMKPLAWDRSGAVSQAASSYDGPVSQAASSYDGPAWFERRSADHPARNGRHDDLVGRRLMSNLEV
jgi:hypothetical protein